MLLRLHTHTHIFSISYNKAGIIGLLTGIKRFFFAKPVVNVIPADRGRAQGRWQKKTR